MNKTIQPMRNQSTPYSLPQTIGQAACRQKCGLAVGPPSVTGAALALVGLWLGAGCQTGDVSDTASKPYEFMSLPKPALAPETKPTPGSTNAIILREGDTAISRPVPAATNALILREGDTVRVTFPGAPNLNTVQQIRRDGQITLPTGGELKAVGRKPTELEADLLKVYGPQLQFKEVVVALESSAFPVFVTGAVLRPGRIMSDRPITALEAIMEAGGFDYTKANIKAVVIVRHEDGQVKNFKLNLKLPLEGKQSKPFYLKPSDIVYVKERFSFF
jgi:polysaccharide export outer membrane protein